MSDHNARILDQFTKQADRYAALVSQTATTTLHSLLDALQPLATDRLLDVGCGTGDTIVALARHVAHATGVDLTPAMLDHARARQRQAGCTNIDWLLADVTALPFADGSFERVVSRAMLHHVPEPARLMAEMKRVCTPGGRLLVIDLTPAPEKAAAFNAMEILRDPSHARALTHAQLRALGARLGLEEIARFQYTTQLPLERVLSASSPGPGMIERVRDLYHSDACQGSDALGFGARLDAADIITVSYPMSMIAWRVS